MATPLLTLITFLPALAGLGLAPLKAERVAIVRWAALGVSVVVLLLAAALWVGFDPKGDVIQFRERHVWVQSPYLVPTITYTLGVDGISLAMVALTAFLMPLAIRASWKQPSGFLIALLFLETGMLGAFVALDLFLFYVFWEGMLIPMYLLIGIWGGPRRIYASVKFILYTIVGSVLMLAAILYTATQGRTFDVIALQAKLPDLTPGVISANAQSWLFLAFAVSFAIKVPLFPFHTWLPDAHVEAPTAGSVILAGVLLKMGTYGFLRYAIPFFPQAAQTWTSLIVALSTVGILYGSLMAMAQSDIKKLVAYSSVAHLGFCMLGIFSGTLQGAQGGVLQMVNHGLSTGALFLLVGVIYEKTHRRGIDDFGGMARVMPIYAVLFMVVTLSSIGLPGLNGFVGEFLVLFGSFPNHPTATALATLGVVLGAVYMLKLYRDVFFGPVTRPEREKVGDVGTSDLGYLLPIVALIILLGILPNLVLSKTQRSVGSVVERLNHPVELPKKVSLERVR
ncbi:MAG TPA: NADH-quinone oxidoreductase subunit M [Planctomycetota bacterium]|nr:NADH-quinone oxidoreductase subunit M [Planctomycetota bacterium]